MKEYALDILFENRFPRSVSIIDYFWHRATPTDPAIEIWDKPFTPEERLLPGPSETEGTYLIVETDSPEPYVFTYCPTRNAWWHPGDKKWTPA